MWNASQFKKRKSIFIWQLNLGSIFRSVYVECLFTKKNEKWELIKRWPGKRTSRWVHISQWVSKTLSLQWSWCVHWSHAGSRFFCVSSCCCYYCYRWYSSYSNVQFFLHCSFFPLTLVRKKIESEKDSGIYTIYMYTLTMAQLLKTAQTNNSFVMNVCYEQWTLFRFTSAFSVITSCNNRN